MTILEGLVAEHRVFLSVFNEIESALPHTKSASEVALLCRVLQRLIHDHGETENDLAYIALDHILKERGQHNRLFHDHQEVDSLLKQVATIPNLLEARSQLQVALNACRRHFHEEETVVFPLIAKALQPETLQILGRSWKPAPGPVPPLLKSLIGSTEVGRQPSAS
jgi:hemerythrin-like domain-containing protein